MKPHIRHCTGNVIVFWPDYEATNSYVSLKAAMAAIRRWWQERD